MLFLIRFANRARTWVGQWMRYLQLIYPIACTVDTKPHYEVSMNSAINLIQNAIESGVFVAEIYVDTVGPPEKYQARLEKIFPGIKIVVAKKADSTYPIVSAASICAKVSRDHALKAWKFNVNENKEEIAYGSGYPNDPATKK